MGIRWLFNKKVNRVLDTIEYSIKEKEKELIKNGNSKSRNS